VSHAPSGDGAGAPPPSVDDTGRTSEGWIVEAEQATRGPEFPASRGVKRSNSSLSFIDRKFRQIIVTPPGGSCVREGN